MDARNIFIVVIVIMVLYYVVSTFITSTGLTELSGSDKQITVDASSMLSGTHVNSSYSIWFYVDDWSSNYGKDKIVFSRRDANGRGITLKLGQHTNDLIVEATHAPGGGGGGGDGDGDGDGNSNINSLVGADVCGSNNGSGTTYTIGHQCEDDNDELITYYTDNNHVAEPNGNCNLCKNTPPSCGKNDTVWDTCADATPVVPPPNEEVTGFTNMFQNNTSVEGFNIFNMLRPSTTKEGVAVQPKTHTCTVRNIPIQKWVNIIISFNGTTLDVYMNGKLVKTCIMKNPVQISGDSDVIITPSNSTFSGQTSKFKFWNTPMDPQRAWYTYSDGYTSGLGLASFMSKYGIKMSLLENNIETTSLTI